MKSPETIGNKLKSIFSTKEISLSEEALPTQLTVYPSTIGQVCELVKLARKNQITLFPLGGGTHLFSYGKKFLDVSVSLKRIPSDLDHSPADLVATVPAGMTFSSVQEQLSKNGQMISLDPSHTNSSTVGGIIATNSFGPRRYRYGTARDCVLETTLINSKGLAVKSGAKTVKNVSGYDLNKLYIGSLGTLGILKDITFKLFPIPEKRVTISADFESPDKAVKLTADLRKIPLDIESTCITNGVWNPSGGTNWTYFISLAGGEKAITPQIDRLFSIIKTSPALNCTTLSSAESNRFWKVVNQTYPKDGNNAKITVIKKYLKSFFNSIFPHLTQGYSLKIFPDSGIVYIHCPEDDDASEFIKNVIGTIRTLGGYLEFELLPRESTFERWPILPSSLPWMKKIKMALDPEGIFAPGTFVGGI